MEQSMKNDKPIPLSPFDDEKFKHKSLSYGTLEDRRRFEQNLIKFGVVTTGNLSDQIDRVESETTIIEERTVNNIYGDAIWELIGLDAWYKKGDVRVKNYLGVGVDPEVPVHIAGTTRIESHEDDSGSVYLDLIVGEA